MKKQIELSEKALDSLRLLGRWIRDTRLRNDISATSMAEQMDTTRVTLGSIERGLPTVSMGLYIKALTILGQEDKLIKVFLSESLSA